MRSHPALEVEVPAQLDLDAPIEHRWIQVGSVRLHVALAGPESGPKLVLLHGFPEAWFGWRHQIDALVSAGYRLAVPDQRGYNLSEKPIGVGHYRLHTLAADVVGLAQALGWARYGVIGHDWGAAVTWQLVQSATPGLVAAAILNVPEPRVMRRFVFSSRQILRSWYILFFQLPLLPEWLIGRKDGKGLAWAVKRSALPDAFTPGELSLYRRAWGRLGALRATLSWYRAAVQRPLPRIESRRISLPMLILWGEQDRFLGKEMVGPSARLIDDVEVIRFADSTHWVQHEKVAEVNSALTRFFEGHLPP